MQKSTKVLIFILSFLILSVGGLFALYRLSPPPQVRGDYSPNLIQKIAYNAPIKIEFSNKMNKKLTEKAFQITPQITGDLSWENAYTLVFTPTKKFEIGQMILVTISQSAQDILGKKLENNFEAQFKIIGAPQVIFVSPITPKELALIKGLSTEGLDDNPMILSYSPSTYSKDQTIPKITVMFDRPLRELTTLEESDQNQNIDFLEITPPLQGSYKWLGTSAIQFIPTELPMATKFEIKISSGLKTLDAGFTEKDYIWHFETEEPRLIDSSPQNKTKYFDPKNPIKLHFNQQINLDTLYQGLNIYPPKDGFFNGELILDKKDLTTVIITPKPALEHPANYTLSIQKGLRGLNGTKENLDEIQIQFQTYDEAKIVSHTPKNGETKVKDISIQFNTPMDEESLKSKIKIKPEVKNLEIYLVDDEVNALIRGNFQPGYQYTLELEKGAKDKFGQLIKENLQINFTMADADAYISLMARGEKGFFSEEIGPEYYLRSINLKKVEVELCKIDEKAFLEQEKHAGWYDYRCNNPEIWSFEIESPKNVYQTTALPLDSKIQGKGIYFLTISSPEYRQDWGKKEPYRFNQLFFVADSSLSLKSSKDEVLVWANNLQSGNPIEGMQIEIVDMEKNQVIAKGVTDKDGIYREKTKMHDYIYVFGKKDTQWSLVGGYWSEGISYWDFGLDSNWYQNTRNFGYLYTDRPIYRPQDDVFFKGIIRQENDVNFSIPKDKVIPVKIEDSYGQIIFEENLPLNENGTFNSKITLNKETPLGAYYLSANLNDNYFNRIFWVEEYRKPEFKVEVSTNKQEFTNQEKLEAKISGNYYFGGALQNADVEWFVLSDDYYFDQYEGEWYNFSANENWGCWWWNYCDQNQEIIASGKGKLNSEGIFTFELPLDIKTKKMSQLYSVSATITDINHQQVTKRETVIVHQGDFYIGIKNRDYLGKTDEKNYFDLITVDSKGAILKNQKVLVEFYKREWNSIKKEGIDGSFYWENEPKDTLVSKAETITGENGKASIDFTTKEGGYYVALAKGKDLKENEISALGSIYITDTDYIGWGVQNHDRIDLVLDKPSYKIGETAKLLVKSPFEKPVKALFTLERQNILTYKLLTLKGNSEVIEIPITEKMLPNLYASIIIFKGSGNEYKIIKTQKDLENIQLSLVANQKEIEKLNEEIKILEKEIADTIKQQTLLEEDFSENSRYQIKTKKLQESQSRHDELTKQQAELLISTQNKNKEISDLKKTLDLDLLAKIEANQLTKIPRPEFKLGYTTIFVNTESKRLNLKVNTDKNRYHAGETVKIKLTTTDQQGKGIPAEVSLAVVDESILALKSRNLEDLVRFFYEKRGLSIQNAQSLVYFVERLNVKAQKGEKGGGGDDKNLDKKKRGEFKDTALWEPNLLTNQTGEAEISFQLPDNLTTWQILAIGATKDTLVGSTEKDFMTTKDIILRPVQPRFLRMADELEIGAIVQNNTDKTQKLKVTLNGIHFEILEATEKQITVEKNNQTQVMWKVKIEQNSEPEIQAKFNFLVENALYRDEVENVLPVYSYSVPEVVVTSGKTEELAKEKIYLPETIDQKTGSLEFIIAPTLINNLTQSFSFLTDFAYGCAEQTMSRHLSNVVFKQIENTFTKSGLKKVLPENAKTDEMINDALQKIYQLQRYDGGWGFWSESMKSYPYLSAYILFGLNETQKAGYKVNSEILNNAKNYLKNYLNRTSHLEEKYFQKITPDEEAFALWVLSELGENNFALSQNLYNSKGELSLFAQGFMMLNFLNTTRIETSPEIQKNLQEMILNLKSRIETQAIIDLRGTHFEEKKQNYYSMGSNTRTNAVLLKAFINQDLSNPLIPKLVNWMRKQKQNNQSATTQESIWTLLAFNDYFLKTKELEANYNLKVSLNKKEKINTTFNSTNLFSQFEFITTLQDLKIGFTGNEILFNKEGKGNLYYDLILKYYLPLEKIADRNEGMLILREYFDFKNENILVTEPKVGDILKGKLTMIIPEERHYVLAEEFLPAGFELINFNLETENQNLAEQINLETEEGIDKSNIYPIYQNENWRFYHREYRDDRLALFADYLPAGVYEFEYLVRVTSSGQFHHLPAQIHEMYFPEVFGRTNGQIINITN